MAAKRAIVSSWVGMEKGRKVGHTARHQTPEPAGTGRQAHTVLVSNGDDGSVPGTLFSMEFDDTQEALHLPLALVRELARCQYPGEQAVNPTQ